MYHYYSSKNYKSYEGQKGKITINIIVIAGILIVCAVYLIEINRTVAQAYQLREFREQFQTKLTLSHELEIKAAEQKSVLNLEKVACDLKMVNVDKISYLPLTRDRMAYLLSNF